MKNFSIVLAVVTALVLSALGTAQAREKGRRHDAQPQRHAPMQHRASPRRFQHAVDRRQARQHARIRQGWRSGRLNQKQVARLHRNQKRIRKTERHFGADGYYTRHERRIMNRKLNRSSKRIWRMKGNHYRPKPRYRRHGRFHRHFRRPHRHHPYIYRAYPVYDDYPRHSLGVDIETKDFRFSVNRSE